MSTSANLQPTWFIASTGSNRNTGADDQHPIRDCEERRRRVGREPVRQPTTITYLDSPPDVEIFDHIPIGAGGSLTIQGQRSVVITGTLTAFTAFNRATPSKNIIADTNLPGGFAAHVGRHMRVTAGPRVGTTWVVTKDLGGGVAEISTPGTTSTAVTGTFTRAAPQAGDAYEIVTMPVLKVGVMDFVTGSQQRTTTGFNRVVTQDLELDFGNKTSGVTTDLQSGVIAHFVFPIFVRCRLDAISISGYLTEFYQCYHAGYAMVLPGTWAFFKAGAHTSHVQAQTGSYARLDYDQLFQGGAITCSRGGYMELGTVAIFDKNGDAIAINPGGTVICTPLNDGGISAVWGTGNGGHGVSVESGSTFRWYGGAGGAKPTVNAGLGLGREVGLGGSQFLWSDVPREANDASIGTWPDGQPAAQDARLASQPGTLQGGLVVDPANVTGVATAGGSTNATVDGITGRVFDSWANLVAAWGTTEPVFSVSTTIVFASANVVTDPVYFKPLSTAAISVVIRAPLVAATQGIVLSGVVSKNRPTNVLLQANLGAAVGVVQGMLLVNTSKGNSVARVNKLVAGTTWTLSQPLTPVNPLAYAAVPTEVDTWANGDVVNAYTLIPITVTEAAPSLTSAGAGHVAQGMFFFHANAVAPVTSNAQSLLFGQCTFAESTNGSGMTLAPSAGQVNYVNHCFSGALSDGASQVIQVVGGLQAGNINTITVASRLSIDGDFISNSGVVVAGSATIGFICFGNVGTNIRVNGFGLVRFKAIFYGGTAVYGEATGDIVLEGSAVARIPTGTTFASQWFTNALVNQGIVLNDTVTGSSSDGGSPAVIRSGIVTTVANLDATVVAGGFGGKAFKLGGACVTNLEGP